MSGVVSGRVGVVVEEEGRVQIGERESWAVSGRVRLGVVVSAGVEVTTEGEGGAGRFGARRLWMEFLKA